MIQSPPLFSHFVLPHFLVFLVPQLNQLVKPIDHQRDKNNRRQQNKNKVQKPDSVRMGNNVLYRNACTVPFRNKPDSHIQSAGERSQQQIYRQFPQGFSLNVVHEVVPDLGESKFRYKHAQGKEYRRTP